MAILAQPFNPNAHQPAREGGGGGLPVGRHQVVILSDEIKAVSSGNGHMLSFKLIVVDGPAKNKTQNYNLNLYHNNPQTVQIAEDQLTSLCYVTGTFQLGSGGADTSVLWNKPFYVEIAMQAGSDKYTEVVNVFDLQGNSAVALANGQGAQQQPAQQNNFQQQPTPATSANGPAAASNWNNTPQQPSPAAPAAPGGGWNTQSAPAGNQAPAQPAATPAAGWQQANPGGQPAGAPWGGGR